MIKAFATWAKREFNPCTIRGWWLFACIAPVWSVYTLAIGWISSSKLLMVLDAFAAGALFVVWANNFTFRKYGKTCDRYGVLCDEYQAEMVKVHTAFAISQAALNSALRELAKQGIFMTNVQVHIHPTEPKDHNSHGG